MLVAGERELVTSRFFAAVPNRIFLPAGSTEEGRLAWPRLPATAAVAGRVVVFGPVSGASSPSGHVGQLFEPRSPAGGKPHPAVRTRPFRVEPLPVRVTVADVRSRAAAGPAPPPGHLCLGVEGDELLPAYVPLPPGAVLAVLGGHASGKTSLLSALPGLNPGAGLAAVPGGSGSGALVGRDPRRRGRRRPGPGGNPPGGRPRPAAARNQQPAAPAQRRGWRVVLTAGFSPGLRLRVPLVQNAAGPGRGVLIAPRALLDGDLFGVRFELEQSPPPGRAVLISDGRARAAQLALDPAAHGDGRSP